MNSESDNLQRWEGPMNANEILVHRMSRIHWMDHLLSFTVFILLTIITLFFYHSVFQKDD